MTVPESTSDNTTSIEPASPGVRRRTLLALPFGLAASLGLGHRALAGLPPDGFEALAERWKALRDGLGDPSADQEDAYLHELSAAIVRCPRASLPAFEKPSYQGDGVKSGPAWFQGTTFVVELRVEPGAVIRAHNHVGYCNVSVGHAGDCEVRHYEPVGTPPEPKADTPSFRVREAKRVWLKPGRVSDLSRTRHNIHWFRAGKDGATILDFTTKMDSPGGGYETFSALEVDEKPTETGGRIHEARWIGNPFK